MKKLMLVLLLLCVAVTSKAEEAILDDYQRPQQIDCQAIKVDSFVETICFYDVEFGSDKNHAVMWKSMNPKIVNGKPHYDFGFIEKKR